MGTQAIYGFRKDGRDKLTVMNNSGYPSYFGAEILSYLRPRTLDRLRETCDRIVLIPEGSRPTPQQIVDHLALARLEDPLGVSVGEAAIDAAYNLLREAQGDLSVYEPEAGFYLMEDYGPAMRDSFWTDWAYVINLDSGQLEIYLGHNTVPSGPGRYAATGSPTWTSEPSQLRHLDGSVEYFPEKRYYGMALLAEYPLSALPGDAAGWAATLEGMADVSYRLRWEDSYVEYPDGRRVYGVQDE